jgi:hypothetical protein
MNTCWRTHPAVMMYADNVLFKTAKSNSRKKKINITIAEKIPYAVRT